MPAKKPDLKVVREIRQVVLRNETIWSVVFSPSGDLVAVGTMGGSHWFWTVNDNKPPRQLIRAAGRSPFSNGAIQCMAFSPDGKRMLCGIGNTVLLLDIASGKEIRSFQGHRGPVRSVVYYRDGRRALSGSTSDYTIREWDLETGKELRTLQTNERPDSLSLSPDERFVVTPEFTSVQIWDLRTGEKAQTLEEHPMRVHGAFFISGGEKVFSGSADDDFRIWDASTGKLVKKFGTGKILLENLAVSTDWRWVLAGGTNEITFWDLVLGKEIKHVGNLEGEPKVAFSPDSHYAISAELLGSMRLWEMPSVE